MQMQMQTQTKIQYVANACRWFDKVNGNTYHSVRITRTSDGAILLCEWTYGYGDHYRQTAFEALKREKWITTPGYYGDWERINNYPIQWNVSDGLKREMVANGK